MNLSMWFRLGVWTALAVCNPVPNPGGIRTMTCRQPAVFRQTALWEFPGFDTDSKGEGYHGTTSVIGAGSSASFHDKDTANCGHPPPAGRGPRQYPSAKPVQKRSFIRACRRAMQNGSTGYHGRTWNWIDFPAALRQKVSEKGPAPRTQRPRVHRRAGSRLSIIHWNPGGLSQGRFHELKAWLRHCSADIVVISETRWSFDGTWHDDHWAYLHSATSEHRSGGLLVMVSRNIASPQMIGYEPLVPGRCLHVRIHFEARAIDILAIYQYVCQRTQISKQQRSTIWSKMDECLSRLPQRNLLVCAGDFNCNLPEWLPWTGPNSFKWQGQRHHGRPHDDH